MDDGQDVKNRGLLNNGGKQLQMPTKVMEGSVEFLPKPENKASM